MTGTIVDREPSPGTMEQGRVAACHAFAIPFKESVDPLAPFGVYTIPEVAMVGMTEEAARNAGLDHEVGRGWFSANARARSAGATEGLVKLVVRRDDRVLVGVHILAEEASELIHQGQPVLHQGASIDYFIHATFNVPTLSEATRTLLTTASSVSPARFGSSASSSQARRSRSARTYPEG